MLDQPGRHLAGADPRSAGRPRQGPDALSQEGRVRQGDGLLSVWLRAEQVRDLVVLRAHTLRPAVLAALHTLATAAQVTAWTVWHHARPPPPLAGVDAGPPLGWAAAESTPAIRSCGPDRPGRSLEHVRAAARGEARAWPPPGPPPPRH